VTLADAPTPCDPITGVCVCQTRYAGNNWWALLTDQCVPC
jgi:hypothetical protein